MASLSVLQNRMKRDPIVYKDDFLRQLSHFEAVRTLLLEQATPQTGKETSKQFGKLASFLSATAPCYAISGEGKRVPELLISCLESHASSLEPDVRLKLLQAIILLRAKGLVGPERVMEVSFGLFRIRDKPFRSALYQYIVKDVRVVNKQKANLELNRKLQTLVFKMLSLETETPAACKRALSVVIELYKRRVWTDARSVNVVADACFSKLNRNAVAAARFFLGIDNEIDEMQEEDEQDEEAKQMLSMSGKNAQKKSKATSLRAMLKMGPQFSKKTKSRLRQRDKAKKALKKIDLGSDAVQIPQNAEGKRMYAPRFPAIELLFDPQGFCERLFKVVTLSHERFEVRLIQLNLISRVIGFHKVLLFPFYSFCQKYLQPHQESINQLLACVIQASHDRVPAEVLDPLVHVLANNFINERSGPEVVSVGMNTVREMIVRVPLLTELDGMKELIQDLVAYRKSRDRSIVIAARTLLHELRKINPRMLAKKDRGKEGNLKGEESTLLAYGDERAAEGVDGIELLEQWLASHDNDESIIRDEGDDDDFDDLLELDDDDKESDDGDEEEESDEFDDEEEGNDDESENEDCAPIPPEKIRVRLDSQRILSEDDFQKIRALKKLQLEGKLEDAPVSGGNKRQRIGKVFGFTRVNEFEEDDEASEKKSRLECLDEDELAEEFDEEDEEQFDPSVMNPASLDGVKKKRRRELAEKLLAIKEDNLKKKALKSNRVLNNSEKAKKTKDFNMVQKSKHVRVKQKASLHDQQMKIKGHMKSLQKKSKLLTKMRNRG